MDVSSTFGRKRGEEDGEDEPTIEAVDDREDPPILSENGEIEKIGRYEPQLWCLGCRLTSTRLSHSTLSAHKANKVEDGQRGQVREALGARELLFKYTTK